jgi:hypothetical protein
VRLRLPNGPVMAMHVAPTGILRLHEERACILYTPFSDGSLGRCLAYIVPLDRGSRHDRIAGEFEWPCSVLTAMLVSCGSRVTLLPGWSACNQNGESSVTLVPIRRSSQFRPRSPSAVEASIQGSFDPGCGGFFPFSTDMHGIQEKVNHRAAILKKFCVDIPLSVRCRSNRPLTN